jgi:hypothetical protein
MVKARNSDMKGDGEFTKQKKVMRIQEELMGVVQYPERVFLRSSCFGEWGAQSY